MSAVFRDEWNRELELEVDRMAQELRDAIDAEIVAELLALAGEINCFKPIQGCAKPPRQAFELKTPLERALEPKIYETKEPTCPEGATSGKNAENTT